MKQIGIEVNDSILQLCKDVSINDLIFILASVLEISPVFGSTRFVKH